MTWGPMWVRCLQVAGTVAADSLQLGNITVQNQGFGLVLSSSSDFLDISCDGLFVSLPLSHLSSRTPVQSYTGLQHLQAAQKPVTCHRPPAPLQHCAASTLSYLP